MKQTAPANERLPKAEIGGAMLRSSSCLGSEASPSQSGTARSAAGYGRTTCACPEATAPPLACAPARESPSPDRTPHPQRLPSRRPQDTQEGGHRPSDRRGQRHVKRGDPRFEQGLEEDAIRRWGVTGAAPPQGGATPFVRVLAQSLALRPGWVDLGMPHRKQ